MTCWISLSEAREIAHGHEEWWKCEGRYGECVDGKQHSNGPLDRPVWFKKKASKVRGKSSMYLGGWTAGSCTGFGVYYFDEGYVIAGVRLRNKRKLNSGKLIWLQSAPAWITNEWPNSVIHARSDYGEETERGLPFLYLGGFVEGYMEDQRAAVILKDGTTRIGPWKQGVPVGDWWEDHEERYTTQGDIQRLQSFGRIRKEVKIVENYAMSLSKDSKTAFTVISESPSTVATENELGDPGSSTPEAFVVMDDLTAVNTTMSSFDSGSSSLKPVVPSDHADEGTEATTGCDVSVFGSSENRGNGGGKDEGRRRLAPVTRGMVDKIAEWLRTDVLGVDSDPADVQSYASRLHRDGFHSVEMIKSKCSLDDVAEWMKKAHIRLFVEHVPARRAEVTQWLAEEIFPQASTIELEVYRKKFLDLGLDSVDMIREQVTPEDVEEFEFMKFFHKRRFVVHAGLKADRTQEV